MTTYLVATSEPPTIVCPPWCTVSTETHLAELETLEGLVVHLGADAGPSFTGAGGDRFAISLVSTTTVDGHVDEAPVIAVNCTPRELTPAQAIEAAGALIALAKQAQA